MLTLTSTGSRPDPNSHAANAAGTSVPLTVPYALANEMIISLSGGAFWDPAQDQFAGSTTLIAVLPGDVNFDRVVNGLDISLVASHWLQSGVNYGTGDANGDGVVNGLDIALIASHWLQAGAGGAGNGSAVPEPATIMLAAFGALALFGRRRRLCRLLIDTLAEPA
jgi:hypothetical protein